jgi:hypothetical protein
MPTNSAFSERLDTLHVASAHDLNRLQAAQSVLKGHTGLASSGLISLDSTPIMTGSYYRTIDVTAVMEQPVGGLLRGQRVDLISFSHVGWYHD